ncbi:MAG: DUF3108 domain-containing protein [Zhengella sp.]|uniref:DUF3108 domain-containing protein n=1 Tax=Zhengella sp. TaxID=2282762 RepID=UPI001DD399CF|nr:DUF3108 domain-containing protein [Notoacmeibacter sp.]MCC0028563.1 DUF3108 domain-containing protein [Brucellaceae bacterium]
MIRLSTAALAAALAVMPAGADALDAGQTFVTEYAFSLLGLPLGVSHFESSVQGDRFTVEGTVRSAGLARLFDSTVAQSRVEGRLTGDGLAPETYAMSYVSGDRKRSTELTFRNSDVVATRLIPKPPRGERLVPVTAEHLKAVSDPMTAGIVRAASPQAVCQRSLRVFDGRMRMDIVLSDPKPEQVDVSGYRGPAVTCKARFIPVAGYRKGKKAIEFLRDNDDITVTFARRGSTDIYAPVKASVPTMIGRLRISATRFGPAE